MTDVFRFDNDGRMFVHGEEVVLARGGEECRECEGTGAENVIRAAFNGHEAGTCPVCRGSGWLVPGPRP